VPDRKVPNRQLNRVRRKSQVPDRKVLNRQLNRVRKARGELKVREVPGVL
jgi:hypothetical protein